jgi:hypothetical protein
LTKQTGLRIRTSFDSLGFENTFGGILNGRRFALVEGTLRTVPVEPIVPDSMIQTAFVVIAESMSDARLVNGIRLHLDRAFQVDCGHLIGEGK